MAKKTIDLTIGPAKCCGTCLYFKGRGSLPLEGRCEHPDLEKRRGTTRMSGCAGYKETTRGATFTRIKQASCQHEYRQTLEHKYGSDGGYTHERIPRISLTFGRRCSKCNKIYDRGPEKLIFENTYTRRHEQYGQRIFSDEINPVFTMLNLRWKELKVQKPIPEDMVAPLEEYLTNNR